MVINQTLTKKWPYFFGLIWAGQFMSVIGSSLTGFALGVWIFQQTGSATQYGLMTLAVALPGIVLSPVAGVLVDRWDRRWTMILSDVGAGLCTALIWWLLVSDRIVLWQLYAILALSSVFSALQWPAYSASTTVLVPKTHYGRATGMIQLGEGIAQVIAPAIAGTLLAILHIEGVIFIDFATFLFAVFTLLLVRIPRPVETQEGKASRGSFWEEVTYGWRFIRARPGLLGMLLFFAGVNLTEGIVIVLIVPLVLGFANEVTLGVVMSVAGSGALVGAIAMSIWGEPKKLVVHGVLGATLLRGIILLLGGLQPNAVLVAAAAFIFLLGFQIMLASAQVLWMRKVPADVQGRVFATRRMIAWITTPLAYLIAGPLADLIFEPLMASDGLLASTIGQIIGVGPGRGIGLLFIIIGSLIILMTLLAYAYKPLRTVETSLPDVVTTETM